MLNVLRLSVILLIVIYDEYNYAKCRYGGCVMLNVVFHSGIMVLRQFIEKNCLCQCHFNGDWRGWETI